ncbi:MULTISPECIES: replication protein [unclassified Halomonas]|uniref:replication protein n=1 Tax=unclassified Halomonas TaxID=2609666 RepID=UPI0020769822|nr:MULTISPECIES: replication protein [unclassified Halomonas]
MQAAEIIHFPGRYDNGQPPAQKPGRSIQVEDGYTRTANAIVDALMKAPLTSREARIVRAVERATYGWNKPSVWLAASVLSEMTGMPEGKCSETLNALIRKRVLVRLGSSRSPVKINKQIDEWDFTDQKARVTPKRKADPVCSESPQDGVTEPPQVGVTNKDRKDTNPSSLRSEGEPSASGGLDLTPTELPGAKPAASSATTYPDDFEAAWSAYPRRAGGNPKKSAFKAWAARRKQGVSAEALQAGAERYALFIRAKGDERTEFVMQGQRFFGPNAEYENDWLPPVARPAPRHDGRKGFAQPLPVGSYGTNDLEMPDWAKE